MLIDIVSYGVTPAILLLSYGAFTIILYISGVSLALLNVSEIKTPKLSGNPRNVWLLGAYTLAITVIYSVQLI